MKKSLIALAVASAISSPAFAATSNVDIYGQFDVSVDYASGLKTVSNTNALQKDSGYRLSSNASRIGFKGTEDLGGGLAAIWQFEQGVNLDGGGAASGWGNSRNSFLGLKSGFGTVVGGTHDTPYKMSTSALDPFADTAGDYNAIVGSILGVNVADLRLGNVLAYISPNFSGVTFAAATSFLKENGVNNVNGAPSAWSAMINYANGPLYLSAAYEKASDLSLANSSAVISLLDNDLRSWKLGAGYTFGNFTVNAIYEDIKATLNSGGTFLGTTVLAADLDLKRKAWGLNGVYNMGAVALKAGYYDAGKVDTNVVSIPNSGSTMWEVGADYNLSKRTKAYVVYTKVSNDNNSAYCAGGSISAGLGSSGVSTACGDDPSILALGMRHSF